MKNDKPIFIAFTFYFQYHFDPISVNIFTHPQNNVWGVEMGYFIHCILCLIYTLWCSENLLKNPDQMFSLKDEHTQQLGSDVILQALKTTRAGLKLHASFDQ